MKSFDGLSEEMKKLLSALEDLAAAINGDLEAIAKLFDERKEIALLKREAHEPVFCIALPRSPHNIAPLWRTSRAYYRPSEMAGSAHIRSFAKEGVL